MTIVKWIPSLVSLKLCCTLAYGQPNTLVLVPINNPALNEYDLRRMAVDKNYNLWLGTDNGIVKYDGNRL